MPHKPIKREAHVLKFRSSVGKRRPAEIAVRPYGNGFCSGQRAAMPPIILRINKEAFSIVRVCGGRGGHRTEGVVVERLVHIFESVDMDEERCQIARCRNPT